MVNGRKAAEVTSAQQKCAQEFTEVCLPEDAAPLMGIIPFGSF